MVVLLIRTTNKIRDDMRTRMSMTMNAEIGIFTDGLSASGAAESASGAAEPAASLAGNYE